MTSLLKPQPLVYRMGAALIAAAFMVGSAHGVILLNTGDPTANTTEPTGNLAGSGWQFEGSWGGFLGTPIAPQFFISADHVGNQNALIYQGVSYPVVNGFKDPFSDFHLWQIAATQSFPSFAPLCQPGDVTGQPFVVIGRGTQRGDALLLNGTQRGWRWGAADGTQRWGQNAVATEVSDPDYGDLLYARFDNNAAPNECHLSSGDSGGAIFLQQNGTWKLAGINLAVDDVYTSPSEASQLTAAIYDARGYYTKTGPGTFALITGTNPAPTGFFATRISTKLDWINSVIDPSGDADGNGIPNLLQYARSLNAPGNQSYRAPAIGVSNAAASITYYRIMTGALQYQVQQSSDLTTWTLATVQEQIVGTSANVQTVAASVTRTGAGPLFLRVTITQ